MTTTTKKSPEVSPAPSASPEVAAPAPSSSSDVGSANATASDALRSSLPFVGPPVPPRSSETSYEFDAYSIRADLQNPDAKIQEAAQRDLKFHDGKIAIGGGDLRQADLSPEQSQLITDAIGDPRNIIREGLNRNIISPTDVADIMKNTSNPDFIGKPVTFDDINRSHSDLLKNSDFVSALTPEQGKELQSWEQSRTDSIKTTTDKIQQQMEAIDPSGGTTFLGSHGNTVLRPSGADVENIATTLTDLAKRDIGDIAPEDMKALDAMNPEILKGLAGTEIANGQLKITETGKIETPIALTDTSPENITKENQRLSQLPDHLRQYVPRDSSVSETKFGNIKTDSDGKLAEVMDPKKVQEGVRSGDPSAWDAATSGKVDISSEDKVAGWRSAYRTNPDTAWGLIQNGKISPDEIIQLRQFNTTFATKDGRFIHEDGRVKQFTSQEKGLISSLSPEQTELYFKTLNSSAVGEVSVVADQTPSVKSASERVEPENPNKASSISTVQANNDIKGILPQQEIDKNLGLDQIAGTKHGDHTELKKTLPDGSRVAVYRGENGDRTIRIGSRITYEDGNAYHADSVIYLNRDGSIDEMMDYRNDSSVEISGQAKTEMLAKLKALGLNLGN